LNLFVTVIVSSEVSVRVEQGKTPRSHSSDRVRGVCDIFFGDSRLLSIREAITVTLLKTHIVLDQTLGIVTTPFRNPMAGFTNP
jgi:hypothetical protein